MAHRLSRRQLARHSAEQLLAGVSQKVVSERLAAYLIESRRMKEVDLLAQDIATYLAQNGTVIATVTSAFELAEATQKSLRELITKQTGATQISLEQKIDPTVLGGVKLELPGQELDATVARKLNQLKSIGVK